MCHLSQNGACGSTTIDIIKGSGSIATIAHDPSACSDPSSCVYIFAVRNQYGDSRPISLMVNAKFENPGDVELEKSYKNEVSQGQYIPHKISPDVNSKIQPFINRLKITVNSIVGDADLFVSQS